MVRRPPIRAPAWLFCLAVVAAWLLGAELAVFTAIGKGLPTRLPGLAVWSFVVLSVAFLVVTGRREILGGRQTAHLVAQLEEALASFGMLTETSLAALPLDELLGQLLRRLGEVLDIEVSAIFLRSQPWELTPRASCGLDACVLSSFTVTPGVGMIAAIVATGLPQAIADAHRLDILASQLHYSLASAAGCPIVVDGQLIGVCIVGTSVPFLFDDRRLHLLQLVADRAGMSIERARLDDAQQKSRAEAEGARRRVVMLATASDVLLAAKDDYEDSLVALVDVVVPEVGDWCTIELADPGGGLRAVATRHVDRAAVARTTGPGAGPEELLARFPETAGLAADVFLSGVPKLSVDDRAIVVAIQAGASIFGTMTIAIDPGRPAYRARDVSAAVELASRVATTVERVLRYHEAQHAAEASQRRAAQLHQLVRASIDVQQLGDESEVLAKFAERARQVFDAQTAVVTVGLDSREPLRAVAHASDDAVPRRPHLSPTNGAFLVVPVRANRWLSSPVGASHQSGVGTVAIQRRPDEEFTVDDEAVLELLAQMVSTALDNARLYHATQASEARWRVLVEAAPIGIVEVDLDGDVLWWNRAAMALFAWPRAQQRPSLDRPSLERSTKELSVGMTPSFAPDTALRLDALWSEVMAGTDVSNRELTATSAGGEVRDLAVSAAGLLSTTGGIQGILTVVADVTERRRLERELVLAQRMEAIAQLAGGVAHDFNNLLTLITGYTELLERRLEVDTHSVELIDGVHAAITRASLLTGGLLTISRRETARPVVLAPADALRSDAEVLERVLGAGVELGWALDPGAGLVSIDPGQLEQVILNLAINARDAMAGAGRLDIGVGPAQLDQAQSEALGVTPGRYVRISVTDSGTGMDAETRLRCFEPLFTTKGPSQGTGLGLAAVKEVVEGSGGVVRVESVYGQGATFRVYLPAVDGVAETATAGDEAGEVAAAPQRTVLVAEDDHVLRSLVTQVLRRDGFRVLEASNGLEALTVAKGWSGTIDAMISDVLMPGASGPDVVASLLASRPGMRVLFMSGGTDGSIPATLPPEPVAFLAKPFKPSQLRAQVRKLFDTEAPQPA